MSMENVGSKEISPENSSSEKISATNAIAEKISSKNADTDGIDIENVCVKGAKAKNMRPEENNITNTVPNETDAENTKADKTAPNPETIYYFAATHWDREWYKTLDKFRFMLVPVMDGILSTLEHDPDFALFTLDGQTCVLADYLAIRPENKERLARLIADKRLLIGPWFTMPDEFLVSAESLIQNLLTGHRIAASYGAESADKYNSSPQSSC